MNNRDSYLNYLNSNHWRALKATAFAAAGRKCEACHHAGQLNLVGHHIHYRNLFDCTKDDIMCLCEWCHDLLHAVLDQRGQKSSDYDRAATIHLVRRFVPSPQMKKKHKKQPRWPVRQPHLGLMKYVVNKMNSRPRPFPTAVRAMAAGSDPTTGEH